MVENIFFLFLSYIFWDYFSNAFTMETAVEMTHFSNGYILAPIWARAMYYSLFGVDLQEFFGGWLVSKLLGQHFQAISCALEAPLNALFLASILIRK